MLDASNALRYPGQEYRVSAEVEIEDMELSGDPIRFEDVRFAGVMTGSGENVSLTGNVTATLLSRCVNCLEDVALPIKAELNAEFARQMNPEDPDLYIFEASALDITDAIRDALILEIPMRILCKESCKGICPVCGQNRNLGLCTCQTGGKPENPFAALKNYVHDDEEV